MGKGVDGWCLMRFAKDSLSRSLSLQQSETVNIIDPLSRSKKQLTSQHKPNTIDFGLQSYGQALSSGSSILVEYLPGNSVPVCTGKDGDTLLMDIDFVIVSKAVPQNIDGYKFTNCEALNGYIPTGMLCDQYSDSRPLGCPVNISQSAVKGTGSKDPDPATGQDRRNLDCYKLALGDAAESVRSIMDGSLVVIEAVSDAHRLRTQGLTPMLSFLTTSLVCFSLFV
ncbi:uncharacterized protein LOC129602734 isoform X2 [Paramacrobiotus metropolitanus]|uniref:uncharacterized protein LOC129602734 isoform X2 n=1 Tax=Paramacrobiotus metropolitanus TaxID=2943436 RepID=UPI0024457A2B|nr:uncharacterized protein LOC129602734 isoform X2 [Paramacrobiotus metropolitanus]